MHHIQIQKLSKLLRIKFILFSEMSIHTLSYKELLSIVF